MTKLMAEFVKEPISTLTGWHIKEQKYAALFVAAPDMLKALKDLFANCAMIHKHWGDGCNQSEAAAAQALAIAAIKSADPTWEPPK